MTKRQQRLLGAAMIASVILAFFAVSWASMGLMYTLELFFGLAVILAAGFMLVGGMMLVATAKEKVDR